MAPEKRPNSAANGEPKRQKLIIPGVVGKSINNIRSLAIDMVQSANSGHPGAPMGLAPVAHVLWGETMNYNPKNRYWPGRDRFVLSNGHSCALQYAMLHLAGYDVTNEDISHFRQAGSRTPGHPENHVTDGIEVTTGPLGQGVANAVGLALASKHIAAKYSRPGFEDLFDTKIYCILGDGCHMEGIASEACSLAGHLGLDNLICVYDDNEISIDGSTNLAFTENNQMRMEAYGWNVIIVKDGDHDLDAFRDALKVAKSTKGRPTQINMRTTIGYGALKEATQAVHGAALGVEECKRVKGVMGMNPDAMFEVLPEVAEYWQKHGVEAGAEKERVWNEKWAKYAAEYPKEAAELEATLKKEWPEGLIEGFPKWTPEDKAEATRKTHQKCLEYIMGAMPNVIGGSADLAPSNCTITKHSKDIQAGHYDGNNIRFGVREHAMGAIANGLAAYGGLLPFVATFSNFLSYCWPAARLAALSEFQVLYTLTHDSIGLGEDGPTHQPIEILALSRACPNMHTFRPADGNETSGAYIEALKFKKGPSIMHFSRQNLAQIPGTSAENVAKGAYTVIDAEDGQPELIFIATGSEVEICMHAMKEEPLANKKVRLVSAPCLELFRQSGLEHINATLLPGVTTIFVEAGGTFGLQEFSHGQIALKDFGASGPYKKIYELFEMDAPNVARRAAEFMKLGYTHGLDIQHRNV
eukprot:Clim_evm11s191 gene=Clim_evmTU11s191